MEICMQDGLPLVKLMVRYRGKEKILTNVLIDTGSSNTIFDTDAVEDLDIMIDPQNGRAKRMYGIGGESELCYEQEIKDILIGDNYLEKFILQLGITKENYGFDAIIGVDFLYDNELTIDFKRLLLIK